MIINNNNKTTPTPRHTDQKVSFKHTQHSMHTHTKSSQKANTHTQTPECTFQTHPHTNAYLHTQAL